MAECFTCGCALRAGEGRRRKVLTGSRESHSTPLFIFGKGQYRSHSSNTYGVRTVCVRCCEEIDKQSTGGGFLKLLGIGVLVAGGLIVFTLQRPTSPPSSTTRTDERSNRRVFTVPNSPPRDPDVIAPADPTIVPSPKPSVGISNLNSPPPPSGSAIPSATASAAALRTSVSEGEKPAVPASSSSSGLHHEAEKIAANRVYLAHNALDNGGVEIARKHLKEVLDKYPNTKAAVEAKTLMEKLPPQPVQR